MADLHNLLDEVDEALQQEEEEEVVEGGEEESEVADTLMHSNDADQPTTTSQEWDDDDREQLEVPAALEEFEKKRLQSDFDQEEGDDEDVEAGLLDDDDDVGGLGNDNAAATTASHCYLKLKKLWQQEVACPELLPLDEEMVQEVAEELERREEVIAALGEENGDVEALLESVLKVDADRAKFMLSDLLRTRLFKIQEHPLHMRDLVDRMSEQEIDFLRGYGQLVEHHLRRTVLDHVAKDALKNLDEPDMIDRPNLEQYVFVRVKETSDIDSGTAEEPRLEQHPAGTTLITRYSAIRELFAQGKVELVL